MKQKYKIVKKQMGGFNPELLTQLLPLASGLMPQNNNQGKGAQVGSNIGSIVDTAANFIPGVGPIISQLGLGKTFGGMFGDMFGEGPKADISYLKRKTNDAINPYGGSIYQKGGFVKPQYEAEDAEIVIKSTPQDYIKMHGSGSLQKESSVAGLIAGDSHSEDTDNDGQYGEAMSGGEYILSDKKTIDYKDVSKKNGKSVAQLAKPIVTKLSKLENSTDKYQQNSVKYLKQNLDDIKNTFDYHKQLNENINVLAQHLGTDPKVAVKTIQKGLASGELSISDIENALAEINNEK